jgi:hypothetical protein
MKLSKIIIGAGLFAVVTTSQAAIFSLSNTTVNRSNGTGTMTLSYIGDGVTAGGVADVVFPYLTTITSAPGCTFPSNNQKHVRATVFNQQNLGNTPITLCQITFSISSEDQPGYIPVSVSECFNASGISTPTCVGDPGYRNIRP